MGIFAFLGKLLPRHICEVCGKDGVEYISTGEPSNQQQRYFCRVHRQNMIAEFRKLFVGHTPNMVVVSPYLEGNYAPLYPFYPITDMKKMNFPTSDIEIVNQKLQKIGSEKCKACDESASTIYFITNPDMYKWNGLPLKVLQESEGHFYCKEHCFKQIEGKLLANKGLFNDSGLVAPYGEVGIYVSTPL